MPDTLIHDLRYPAQIAAGAGPDVPLDIKNLADDIDPKLTPFSQGLIGARPPAGKVGQRYRGTDTGLIYLDIGAGWIVEGPIPPDGSVGTPQLADNGVTQPKMADNSVGAAEIIPDAVGNSELGPSAVSAVEVADSLKPSAGAAAAVEALRAIGVGAGQVVAGNDVRLAAAMSLLGFGFVVDEVTVEANGNRVYVEFDTIAIPYSGWLYVFSFQHGADTRGGAGLGFFQQLADGVVLESHAMDLTGGRRLGVNLADKIAVAQGDIVTIQYKVVVPNSPVRWQPYGSAVTVAILSKSDLVRGS